ncbi:Aste57867_23060 [Aphanomyces stellatus]|uniref:Aste57867_23060 protein n=1 Tax=Aphanomyces stellatus TaxID=120398 RepID=A0A485LLV7_9STRA|nr:hypothetical protein As57867_022989 [Aphanomyces stellatus]VFT99708.1 Aste57867_23060 [Aphanomyces stellatus]
MDNKQDAAWPRQEWDASVPVPPPRCRLGRTLSYYPSMGQKADVKMEVQPDPYLDLSVPVPPTRWALRVMARSAFPTKARRAAIPMNQGPLAAAAAPAPHVDRPPIVPTIVKAEMAFPLVVHPPFVAANVTAAPAIKAEPIVIDDQPSPNKRPFPDDMHDDLLAAYQPRRRISRPETYHGAAARRESLSSPSAVHVVGLVASPLFVPTPSHCRVDGCTTSHGGDLTTLTHLPLVDAQQHMACLRDGLQQHGRHVHVALATAAAVETALAHVPLAVLHLVMHGDVHQGLFVEDLRGGVAVVVPWGTFERHFTARAPRLVVLVSPSSHVLAPRLVACGAPVVLAINATARDLMPFLSRFHTCLAQGQTLATSISEAQAVAAETTCAMFPPSPAMATATSTLVPLPPSSVHLPPPFGQLSLPSWPPLPPFLDGFPSHSEVFSGRSRELLDVCNHLVDPRTRLVVVRGTSGIGKTALAVAVARYLHLRGHVDALRYVSVGALLSPQPVALDAVLRDAVPRSTRIGLVVLDDVHLWTQGQSSMWAELVKWSATYPHLKWLVTSQVATNDDSAASSAWPHALFDCCMQPLSLLASARLVLAMGCRPTEDAVELATEWGIIQTKGVPAALVDYVAARQQEM